MEERTEFLRCRGAFEDKLTWLHKVANALPAPNSPRKNWANLCFYRLIFTAISVLTLCDIELQRDSKIMPVTSASGLLDHHSIGSLVRNLIEMSVLFHYITDLAVADQNPEWTLRRAVLELHDSATRWRVLKHTADDSEDASTFQRNIDPLKMEISANAVFATLPAERQEKLLSGSEIYVRGLRAAVRDSGADVEHFNAFYAILSAFGHGTPASFYRHQDEPKEPAAWHPAEYTYLTTGAALEYGVEWLDQCIQRVFLFYPETFLRRQTKQ